MNQRKLVLVGTLPEAQLWSQTHNVPRDQIIIATFARRLTTLSPRDSWVIVLPSFWDLDGHTAVLEQIRRLESAGAHVEWA